MAEQDRKQGFGRYVRECRYRIGNPSQSVVAAGAGISRQWLSLIEQGEASASPSAALLRGLARALRRPYVEVVLVAFGANVTDSEPLAVEETIIP